MVLKHNNSAISIIANSALVLHIVHPKQATPCQDLFSSESTGRSDVQYNKVILYIYTKCLNNPMPAALEYVCKN